MYFLEKIKTELAKEANKILGGGYFSPSDFEYPPEEVSKADLALPCFKYTAALKKSPDEIAAMAADVKNKWLAKIEVAGNYINFYLHRSTASKEIMAEFLTGHSVQAEKKEKILLEYVSPNNNKPLHLGHLRNAFLGEALANILEFTGSKVKRTSLVNDRGIAICKSILALILWGQGDSPKKSGLKSDHFAGKYYVMFEKKAKEDSSLEEKVRELLKKWEAGDKKIISLWKKINRWALRGFNETYERLGIGFDKVDYESDLYEDGRELVLENLKKGLLMRDEKGNILADLGADNLPAKVLLRSDGTAVYATTDLALIRERAKKGWPKVYYIVGSEQDLYFKQLFAIAEKLKLGNGKPLVLRHLSYGMVFLPEGKMKSREGTVVDADELLDKLESLAEEEIKTRYHSLSLFERKRRAKAVALAALKFHLLNVRPEKSFHFNPKESLAFTGKTGPYLLYSYARLHSIWRKGRSVNSYKNLNYSLICEDEVWRLVLMAAKFPEVILAARQTLNPEELTSYLYSLAAKISDFYHRVPVLEAPLPQRKIRIAVISRVLDVLKKGFYLLGFEPLEEM